PGQSIDVSVEFIAPFESGTYQSNWMLQSQAGELFGLGPNGDAPFWVRIQVVGLETPTQTPTSTLSGSETATPTPTPTLTPTITETPTPTLMATTSTP
ncbi:MAG TPA: NBR1-Ig-like domain-containing protein, partial [Anaerolineaceae bacterium]|nr:NBR1-Ig-like domain-containing protein [Anaerolineaceae bacterium]